MKLLPEAAFRVNRPAAVALGQPHPTRIEDGSRRSCRLSLPASTTQTRHQNPPCFTLPEPAESCFRLDGRSLPAGIHSDSCPVSYQSVSFAVWLPGGSPKIVALNTVHPRDSPTTVHATDETPVCRKGYRHLSARLLPADDPANCRTTRKTAEKRESRREEIAVVRARTTAPALHNGWLRLPAGGIDLPVSGGPAGIPARSW